jgi:hypothetical protein
MSMGEHAQQHRWPMAPRSQGSVAGGASASSAPITTTGASMPIVISTPSPAMGNLHPRHHGAVIETAMPTWQSADAHPAARGQRGNQTIEDQRPQHGEPHLDEVKDEPPDARGGGLLGQADETHAQRSQG